jgi:CheY-like chemotaxis protein/two-component sensor histidine kinase
LVHSQNRLRKLASDLSVAEERERRRVAGELHDYLAQLLVATRMKLNQGRHSRSATRQSELLREVDDMLDQSLTYTRTLVAQLSPPVLHEFGLAAAMKWLGEQMPRHGLSVDSTIEARPLNLTENQAVLLFQSARELLLNVVKHAGTGRASVQLKSHGGELRLTVRDEGRGFEMSLLKETAASSNAFGLFSIRERMESLGGRCEIVTRPGHGTIVTLAMPLSGDDRSAEFKVLSAELVEAESPTALSTQASTLSTRHSALRQHARFRVLLVDDHAMVRQGLRSLLENHRDVEVVAEAGDGLQAIALAETLCPDVIVMDLSLPLLDGVEATRRICLAHPAMIVIGLSVHQNRQMEQAVKGAGAAAFLTKDCAVDQLYEAISSAVPARSS